jgi:diguanylate cyclase (GGDEF)-like protein
MALLMIDLNNFKTLNDTLGHAAGDQMLRDLGRIIQSTIRDGDMAFRVGGDEFVVTLSNCPQQAAQRVAERLESLTVGIAAPLKLPPGKPLGLSIGICTLDQIPQPTAEAMLAYADELLYSIKNARKKKQAQLVASSR